MGTHNQDPYAGGRTLDPELAPRRTLDLLSPILADGSRSRGAQTGSPSAPGLVHNSPL
jgi:hypothetical protein